MSASRLNTDFNAPPAFVFAGGGSGGHIYPGLAIAEELKRQLPLCQLHFAASDRGIDQQILERAAVPWTPLQVPTASQIVRRPWIGLPRFWRAWRAAVALLRRTPGAVVVGTGGFVSVPVVLAAAWLRRPVVLLEPNTVPGRATTALQRFALFVCVGHEETAARLRRSTRVQTTGVGLRRELAIAEPRGNLRQRPRQVLILGGSQGAAELNRLVLSVVQQQPTLFSGWTIRHQVGSGQLSETLRVYEEAGVKAEVRPFFDPISEAYRTSQLVISRAGATSLAEFACAGLPAVLVPHREAVRNHQRENAFVFVRAGAAAAIGDGTGQERQAELGRWLLRLLSEEELRNSFSDAMQRLARPQAAAEIAAVLVRCVATDRM